MPTATEKSRHGRFYWCIRSPQSEDGEIYIYADKLEVSPDGALVAWRTPEAEPPHINLALAAGQWTVDMRLHGPRQRRLGGDHRALEGRGRRIDGAAFADAMNPTEGGCRTPPQTTSGTGVEGLGPGQERLGWPAGSHRTTATTTATTG
jgi:hypothetical protein